MCFSFYLLLGGLRVGSWIYPYSIWVHWFELKRTTWKVMWLLHLHDCIYVWMQQHMEGSVARIHIQPDTDLLLLGHLRLNIDLEGLKSLLKCMQDVDLGKLARIFWPLLKLLWMFLKFEFCRYLLFRLWVRVLSSCPLFPH